MELILNSEEISGFTTYYYFFTLASFPPKNSLNINIMTERNTVISFLSKIITMMDSRKFKRLE